MCLPHDRRVVFRGVPVALAKKFRLDSQIVFPPFTSTSLVGREALAFMNSNRPGTFFLLHTWSGSVISHASWYPEQAESLLGTFTTFSVKSKMSKSLLMMLGRAYDIVVVSEDGGDGVVPDAVVVEALLQAAAQTVFVYDSYLETFVESSVAASPPPQDPSVTTRLFTMLEGWLGSAATPHLVILGSGGTGKTSATLAALSRLASGRTPNAFPVFVPLPQVPALLSHDGAIDAYLSQTLDATPAQITLLGKQRTVVLFLDSLDEVGELPMARLRQGLLAGNPLASSMRTVLSSRDEVLTALQPPQCRACRCR
jgi:hypothetical protein